MSIRQSITRGIVAVPLLAGIALAQPALAAHHAPKHVVVHHKTWTVKMELGSSGYIFSPSKLTVHVGDTVKWVDIGGIPHNIVGTNPVSKKYIKKTAIDANGYSVTFKVKGAFKYYCQIHVPNMVGQITVK